MITHTTQNMCLRGDTKAFIVRPKYVVVSMPGEPNCYCIVFYFIVLSCIFLSCIVSYWIHLYCLVLYWIVLAWIGLDWIG